jgi:hypothetical protein
MARSKSDWILPLVAAAMVIAAGVAVSHRISESKARAAVQSTWPLARVQDVHVQPLEEGYTEYVAHEESEWLDAHFQTPIAPQGEAPEGWSPLEASLEPAQCGLCHPTQFQDWQESWHAMGMGPGVMGQIVDWDESNDKGVARCQRCHAPLTEQHMRLDEAPNPLYQEGSREHGLTCAGCHVREWTRYGPPSEGEALENAPHGGFVAREEFESSRFCYKCHDFRQESVRGRIDGKLIQETYGEWRFTEQAAEGVTCQSCHMPEGRHLWLGVHDPEMVRSAFTATPALVENGGVGDNLVATLEITNTGAAHRFPTYTTPQINLVLEQIDAEGEANEGTDRMDAVARHLKPDLSREYFDTRLMPGESRTLDYEVERAAGAVSLRARIDVWPDEAYRRVYERKLANLENHRLGESLLREALANTYETRFTAWEQTLPLE